MTPAFNAATPPNHRQALHELLLSLSICLALYAVDLLCMALLPSSGLTYATNYALPFDLVVVVPLAFYFLIVRRRNLTPVLILPVMWIGMITSIQFVQPDSPSLHAVLLPAVAAIDIIILVKEGRRFLHAFREAQNVSTNPLDWFTDAFFTLTRNKRGSYMAATEMTVWYYVVASWRRTPDVPQGSRAFFYHKKSGYVALVGVLLAMVGVETFALHLLVAQWNEIAAILLTIMSIYTAIWLFGTTRAVVLNPLLVDSEALTVRYGMHFNQRIPLNLIANIDKKEPNLPKNQRMNFGIMGMEPCWIVLHEPIPIRTFTGSTRLIQAINVSPDDAVAFKRLLTESNTSA